MRLRDRRVSAQDHYSPDSGALVEWTEGWEIRESDHGSVYAFHHHPGGSQAAKVQTDAWGTVEARCPDCQGTYSWHSSEGVRFA